MRRERATDVEKILWRALRNRQLGAKFRRQHQVGPFIADFACLESALVIELDGGRHNDAPADNQRTAYLTRQGFRVLRFWNNAVIENLSGVLETVEVALRSAAPPHPDPLPQAGEGETMPLSRLREREGPAQREGEGFMEEGGQ